MLDYASKHDSDMVIPRIAGINGRAVNRSLFARSEPDPGLRKIFGTLAPQKLIRRGRTARPALPRGRVRLEDANNISARKTRPEGYTRSVRRIAQQVLETGLEPEPARLMVLDLYQCKILRTPRPELVCGLRRTGGSSRSQGTGSTRPSMGT